MGASLGNSGGHSRRFRPMSDINVTPMVRMLPSGRSVLV